MLTFLFVFFLLFSYNRFYLRVLNLLHLNFEYSDIRLVRQWAKSFVKESEK